ncbi:unnamed protein product [Closterium sp. Naga37s-1]|nr:unnamed protein product [Closterium sp. Naga37s-1]
MLTTLGFKTGGFIDEERSPQLGPYMDGAHYVLVSVMILYASKIDSEYAGLDESPVHLAILFPLIAFPPAPSLLIDVINHWATLHVGCANLNFSAALAHHNRMHQHSLASWPITITPRGVVKAVGSLRWVFYRHHWFLAAHLHLLAAHLHLLAAHLHLLAAHLHVLAAHLRLLVAHLHLLAAHLHLLAAHLHLLAAHLHLLAAHLHLLAAHLHLLAAHLHLLVAHLHLLAAHLHVLAAHLHLLVAHLHLLAAHLHLLAAHLHLLAAHLHLLAAHLHLLAAHLHLLAAHLHLLVAHLHLLAAHLHLLAAHLHLLVAHLHLLVAHLHLLAAHLHLLCTWGGHVVFPPFPLFPFPFLPSHTIPFLFSPFRYHAPTSPPSATMLPRLTGLPAQPASGETSGSKWQGDGEWCKGMMSAMAYALFVQPKFSFLCTCFPISLHPPNPLNITFPISSSPPLLAA